jgi:two-component system alkaline phosphatase synthesis response regulator PhoP
MMFREVSMDKKRILLVDDEPELVEMLTTRLEANDYDVSIAFDGEAGLKKLRDEMPDLVVLDVGLPGMDGYTFVRAASADEKIKQVPIIILTSRDKMQDLFEMEGIKEYVTKPFEAEELLEKIKKHVK